LFIMGGSVSSNKNRLLLNTFHDNTYRLPELSGFLMKAGKLKMDKKGMTKEEKISSASALPKKMMFSMRPAEDSRD
jgi:hypothetical protein